MARTLGTVKAPPGSTYAEPNWRDALERLKRAAGDLDANFALLRDYSVPGGFIPDVGDGKDSQYRTHGGKPVPGQFRLIGIRKGVVFFIADEKWRKAQIKANGGNSSKGSMLLRNVLAWEPETGARQYRSPTALLREAGKPYVRDGARR